MAKAYLVGSGIASLTAATLLIRDAGMSGDDIVILEEQGRDGGSLDAAGCPEAGYTMRGGRMFELHFGCTYDVLRSIPSLDDPAVSVTDETFAFHEDFAWDDRTRLVDRSGAPVDAHSMGFSERDRLELIRCVSTPEHLLDGKRITDCFHEDFFTTSFWWMWCTTFAFEPWHSAIEFRRYLNRFVHLFTSFDTMSGIYRTRYNQYDSIVRPMIVWLTEQGITIRHGVTVTDLGFADGDAITVTSIATTKGEIPVADGDVVMVTNGSMTADSTLGDTDTPAVLDTSRTAGAWRLWNTLAARNTVFGRPSVFDSSVSDSTWASFTVTTKDPTFFAEMQRFSGREAGKGGLVTFKDSSWLITITLNHQPHFREQPSDTFVWWGYALFPHRKGDTVGKTMAECTGREMLREVLSHLPIERRDQILDRSIVIPALMPYITSQFLVRGAGDRPAVVPAGSTNLAFIGQYAEVPDDVVFTVEYSVRTAWTAVAELLKTGKPAPAVYKGQHSPKVLMEALKTLHRS